jgi:hypothetical protein
MSKKKPDRDRPVFHAERKTSGVKPRIESEEPAESDAILWENIAPDSFAPDKPDQEIEQIISFKDTHRKKSSKRSKGKKN